MELVPAENEWAAPRHDEAHRATLDKRVDHGRRMPLQYARGLGTPQKPSLGLVGMKEKAPSFDWGEGCKRSYGLAMEIWARTEESGRNKRKYHHPNNLFLEHIKYNYFANISKYH